MSTTTPQPSDPNDPRRREDDPNYEGDEGENETPVEQPTEPGEQVESDQAEDYGP